MLPIRPSLKQSAGMTLIEVLIALTIVSIAMTAIIKATAQSIRGTQHLQTKMIATWVAEDVMNELRVNLRELPDSSSNAKEKLSMLGEAWYWQAEQTDSANQRIKKLEVNVYEHENTDDDPVVTLVSYVYRAE